VERPRGDAREGEQVHHDGVSVYTIEVKGELGDRFADTFEGMTLRASDGKTTLVGDVRDQAQLQGLLSRLADFGLVLLSVTQTDPGHEPSE
jgi:hypothetical protein